MTTNLRNTKSTPERLGYIVSLMMAGFLRPTTLAKMASVSYLTLCLWLRESRAGNEKYLIEFLGETVQFAVALDQARKFAASELRGKFEQQSVHGWDEVARDGGQVVWKICPVAAAIKPELRELLGHREDALLVIDGALQPELTRRARPRRSGLMPVLADDRGLRALTSIVYLKLYRSPRPSHYI
jgi:hypothetical protein